MRNWSRLLVLAVSLLMFPLVPDVPSHPSTAVTAWLRQFDSDLLNMDIAWTPDGRFLYVSSSTGSWRFDPANLQQPPTYFEHYIAPLTFRSNMHTAASLDQNGNIIFWNMHTGEFNAVFYDIGTRLIWITDLEFSPDGNQLVMGFGGGTNLRPSGGITLFDVQTGDAFLDIRHEIDDPVYLAFSMDGSRFAAGGYNGLRVWDTNTWSMVPVYQSAGINDLELSMDGQWISVWYWRSSTPGLTDTSSSEMQGCRFNFEYDTSPGDVKFSPDGQQLAGAGRNGIVLYDVATLEEISRTPPASGSNLTPQPPADHAEG